MRVLLATDHFPPYIGGAHRWAALLASGLARRGHSVEVATVWHGGAREEHHGPHRVPVHRVRQLRTAVPALMRGDAQRHAPPFPDPVSVYDLRRVVRNNPPEVVLAHGWLAASVAVALAGSSIPLIVSAHDYGSFCATRRLLYQGATCTGPQPRKCLPCSAEYYGRPKGWTAVAGVALSRWLLARRIAGIQSVTAFVDDLQGRFLLRDRRARRRVARFVVPAFVDASERDEGESASERDEGESASERDDGESADRVQEIVRRLPREPFILFVGAFRADKGLSTLFEAYRRLEHPPPLVLMGTQERDTPPIPDEVITIYDVPHLAVMRAWRRALIGVVPSLLPEPLGTVSVEGITVGVPVIATVPSGMADVLGDAGLLVPQGDADALAGAMRSLLADPDLRARLARRGLARAPRFEAERVLSRYEEMLARVAGVPLPASASPAPAAA